MNCVETLGQGILYIYLCKGVDKKYTVTYEIVVHARLLKQVVHIQCMELERII